MVVVVVVVAAVIGGVGWQSADILENELSFRTHRRRTEKVIRQK